MNNQREAGILHDLSALLRGLQKHWGKATAITLGCVAAGVIYIQTSTPLYTAQAILQVEQAQRRVTTIQDITQEDFRSVETLKTLETRFTTDEILLRVIHANHLEADPQFAQGAPVTEAKLIKRLRSAVRVKLQRSTRLINVEVDGSSPKRACELTASLIEELIRQDFELHAGISKTTNLFLVKQAEELQVKLQKTEQALQTYRETNHAVSLEDKQNIVVDTLKDLNHQLADATSQRVRLESDFAQYNQLSAGQPEELLNIPTVAASTNVQLLRKALSDQEAVIAALSQRYRSEHPQYIQAHSQLRQIRSDLEVAVRKCGAGMKTAAEAAQASENSIRQALQAQQKEAMDLARLAIPYNQLEREIESERALYQSVLGRLKETDVTASLDDDNLRVVQPPRAGELPTRPKVLLILAASLVAGLGAGFGVAVGLESLDQSFKTLVEVENGLGVIVAGTIPKLVRHRPHRLVAWREADSPIAEAFRSLRARLSLGGHDSEHPAVVFTSAVPGEGKSFCSVNYATVLGQQGLRTLLVDAELRQSTISAEILGDKPALGLGDYLDSQCTLEQAIHQTELPNLSLVPCGSLIPNPAELMASPRAVGLVVAALALGFERVVFDAGPLNFVSDALPLIQRVRLVCFVVKAAGAPRQGVDRAFRVLTRLIGTEGVHVVLNLLPRRRGLGGRGRDGKYGDRPVYGRVTAAPVPLKA